MGDQFADLARLDAVVERAADMAADLRGLAGGNQRGDGDEAAVPSGKLRATLDVAEEHVIGKMAEARRDIVDGGRRDGCAGFPRLRRRWWQGPKGRWWWRWSSREPPVDMTAPDGGRTVRHDAGRRPGREN